MKPYLLPYKAGSKGMKALAEKLNCKRLKLEGSKFVHRPTRVVINWGCSDIAKVNSLVKHPDKALNCRVSDGALCVARASNKLSFFQSMKEVLGGNLPEFTTSMDVAKQWCEKGTVVCRTVLNGSGGKGIVVAERSEQVVVAPLYVKYVKKQEEYRVHVFRGKAIDVQRKMRSREVKDEDVNWMVRNKCNGFIFGRNGIEPPADLCGLAERVVDNLGLDFGAVDLIFNAKANKSYVLEVNTAPGLEGQTLDVYNRAIQEFCL